MSVARRNRWTAEEDRILQQKYAILGANIPELITNHTRNAIMQRAYSMGLCFEGSRGTWTAEEDRILQQEYAVLGADIPELLRNHTRVAIRQRANDRGLRLEGSVRVWTAEEDRILQQKYEVLGTDIPELLRNRTRNAIIHRANVLGLWLRRRCEYSCSTWTAQEDDLIRQYYGSQGSDIPGLEHRSAMAIQGRAHDLGVNMKLGWTADELELLVNGYGTYGGNIPGLEHRSDKAIYMQAKRLGLKRNEAVRIKRCSKDIENLVYLYTGEQDGQRWYLCKCKVCREILLVSEETAREFRHGGLCETNRVPEGCHGWARKLRSGESCVEHGAEAVGSGTEGR